MRQRNLIYGYWVVRQDHPGCVFGLWNAVEQYIQQEHIRPTFFQENFKVDIFYNNFELGSQRFFESQDYKKYIDYLDKLGGFWFYRWGDAPVKTLALSLFVKPEQIYSYADLPYRH